MALSVRSSIKREMRHRKASSKTSRGRITRHSLTILAPDKVRRRKTRQLFTIFNKSVQAVDEEGEILGSIRHEVCCHIQRAFDTAIYPGKHDRVSLGFSHRLM